MPGHDTFTFKAVGGASDYVNPGNGVESDPIKCEDFLDKYVVAEDFTAGTAIEVWCSVGGTKYGLLYQFAISATNAQQFREVPEPVTHIKLKASGACTLGKAYLRAMA